MKKILYSNFEGINDILGDMLNTDSKPTKKYKKKSNDLDFQDLNNTTKNLIKKAINRKTKESGTYIYMVICYRGIE